MPGRHLGLGPLPLPLARTRQASILVHIFQSGRWGFPDRLVLWEEKSPGSMSCGRKKRGQVWNRAGEPRHLLLLGDRDPVLVTLRRWRRGRPPVSVVPPGTPMAGSGIFPRVGARQS